MPAEQHELYKDEIYGSQWMEVFLKLGYISLSKDKRIIRPAPLCFRLFENMGIDIVGKEMKSQYSANVLSRGIISAKILLTFYEAGANIYASDLSNMKENSYFSVTIARRVPGNKLYASSRLHGIYFAADTAYIVFFVDDIGVHLKQELRILNLLNQKEVQNTAIIFMGMSTADIADETFNPIVEKSQRRRKIDGILSKSITFHEVYKSVSIPVHFIPFGEEGALVLKLMQMQNNREVVTKVYMRKAYQKPYYTMPDTDSIFYEQPYNPVVLSYDMDVKRIDRAVETAREKGFDKIVLAALPEQMDLLSRRYYHNELAELKVIKVDGIKEYDPILSKQIQLNKPSMKPFVNKDGRWLFAEDFASNRKIGN